MNLVLAGDVVNSQQHKASTYLPVIEESLKRHAQKNRYVIYRGDSFQAVLTNPVDALQCILEIKTGLKRTKGLDVRVAVGLGEITIVDNQIAKSTGSAFTRSGTTLDHLKERNQTIVVSSDKPLDRYMNMCLKMALLYMDSWNVTSAGILYELLKNPAQTQEELGNLLGIKQATVSRRLDRANWSETKELLQLFENYYNDLSDGTIY